jgi:hypothetical protein
VIKADDVSPSVGPTGCLDGVKSSVSCQFEVCILREGQTMCVAKFQIRWCKMLCILDNKKVYGPLKILSQFRNLSDGIIGNRILTTTRGNYSLYYFY